MVFELRSGESWRDPFGAYAALRDHDPVHYAAWGDFYVLSRFDVGPSPLVAPAHAVTSPEAISYRIRSSRSAAAAREVRRCDRVMHLAEELKRGGASPRG
jgi:hypothetical protein